MASCLIKLLRDAGTKDKGLSNGRARLRAETGHVTSQFADFSRLSLLSHIIFKVICNKENIAPEDEACKPKFTLISHVHKTACTRSASKSNLAKPRDAHPATRLTSPGHGSAGRRSCLSVPKEGWGEENTDR